jgi:hypothetical protein
MADFLFFDKQQRPDLTSLRRSVQLTISIELFHLLFLPRLYKFQ